MQNNGIELINIPMGPGSQDEGEMVLDYMKMPSEMNTYDMPVLPETDDVQNCPEAIKVLGQLEQMLNQYRPGDLTRSLELNSLPEEGLELLNQILGEGEVSVVIAGEQNIRIQETVMAGVWRLRSFDSEGELRNETLEVADIPAAVRAFAFTDTHKVTTNLEELPLGVLNAPSVLVEIAEASEKYSPVATDSSEQPHVINLSLLPFSPEDHNYLNEKVGVGHVTLLSRGYGNCRITSTQVDGLWRVQYFNSTDQLILDTLEITDIPAVACAAPEDLEDSAERLKEILEVFV